MSASKAELRAALISLMRAIRAVDDLRATETTLERAYNRAVRVLNK